MMREYISTPDFYQEYLAHHGVKGQTWGVRNGPPYPIKDISKLSNRVYDVARSKIDKISNDVIDAANKSGSKMYGLENKLKTKESISRKIDKNSKEERKSINESANDIKDAIRFTTISSEKEFVSNYEKMKQELENKGYKETRCKNYFDLFNKGKVKHKSVQCTYSTKDGYEFEIQFHTQASQDAKTKKIPIYEERRQIGISDKRAKELEKQMEVLANNIPDPYNIYKIKTHN